jgi:PilZ domain
LSDARNADHSQMGMITQAELEASLEALARGQDVNVGVGDAENRGWFRGEVISHDARAGRLVITCFMDRLGDTPLEPGERVIVAATRMDNPQAAPMSVEYCTSGPEPTVELRMAGVWQHEDERRNRVRIRLSIRATRARQWLGGAWRDLDATLTDISSRGVGLSLAREVHIDDRLSIAAPLGDGTVDLRATIEVRYAHLHTEVDPHSGLSREYWHTGGPFRNMSPPDHERVIRFLFAELRSLTR